MQEFRGLVTECFSEMLIYYIVIISFIYISIYISMLCISFYYFCLSLYYICLDESVEFYFEGVSARQAAPRLFCDICDQFDLHDTEECPKQVCGPTYSSINPFFIDLFILVHISLLAFSSSFCELQKPVLSK